MIPNNNFFGKIHGKTIKDFTSDLDYSLETPEERVKFLNDRLEIETVGDKEFSHGYFMELFEQTFDKVLDKDGAYWVEEEGRYMTSTEIASWCSKNGLDVAGYLNISTPFHEIEYDEDIEDRGIWRYSSVNTSNVKLLLNTSDAQYSESNIAKEISRLADYILAKDKRESRTQIKIYNEKDFNKRLLDEKRKVDPLSKVNGGEFIVLQRVKNYRLAPSLEIHKADFRLPIIYRGDYNDYLKHWKSHQYKYIFDGDKYKKVYIKEEDFKNISTSVCMSEEEWSKGKANMLEKIELLTQANDNRTYIKGKLDQAKQGNNNGKMRLTHMIHNIKDIDDYMKMVKKSYDTPVCISPNKCSVNSNISDIIDYSNIEHILALVKNQGSCDGLIDDMSIINYDIRGAIKKACDNGDIKDIDISIFNLMKKGKTKEEIANTLGISRMTVHRRINRIASAISDHLQGK